MTQLELIDRISHSIFLLKFYRERPRWVDLDFLRTLEGLAHSLEQDIGQLKKQVEGGCEGCQTVPRPNSSLRP